MAELSPMMQQYIQIKSNYKDAILFYRVGDFYEMFFDDAVLASRELELILTGKDCGQDERAPMCGVPFHSYEGYVSRLIEKGYKVAICEQTENPADAKGLVKRDVIRVITPATVVEDSMLNEQRNNYLAAVYKDNNDIGLCFVDASTGDLNLTQFQSEKSGADIINHLGRFYPSEVLLNEQACCVDGLTGFITDKLQCRYEVRPEDTFSPAVCEKTVTAHFSKSLDELKLKDKRACLAALGQALGYLYETKRTGLDCINHIAYYEENQYMRLDLTARGNLELTQTMRSRESKGSLLWVIDKTSTAMGKRMLRTWIEQPLLDPAKIISRQNGVQELLSDNVLRSEIIEGMNGIYDMERLMTRVLYGSATPRELLTFGYTLERMPNLKSLLRGVQSNVLKDVYSNIDPLDDISDLIREAIDPQAPALLKDGGYIKDGFNSEIDSLRAAKNNGTSIISNIEASEREKTGIKTLRVKYTKLFGYCIEVTNSFKDMVPDYYIRKQTLSNCERYVTEELKQQENLILGAHERLISLEYEVFDAIRKKIGSQLVRIQNTASAVARLDTLCALAQTAQVNNYSCPNITVDGVINIKNGRHPVVEKLLKTPFVPNDTYLDMKGDRCSIITGPNMAGKSTYMRQVALIVILAQIGSFVPADSADICICDAIFTRVGASDDLSAGKSTFMVEMSEVADILENATDKSLLVFDEIGRGTSTFDGMAIAKAVLEYVCGKKLGAKTLFATHYHELTELENELGCVKNYNTSVKKRGDDITFLRRIVRGPADGSYGVEVAKLAGIPDEVVKNARRILGDLESQQVVHNNRRAVEDAESDMLSLESAQSAEIIDELKTLDVTTLTPIESMTYLYKLAEKAKNL